MSVSKFQRTYNRSSVLYVGVSIIHFLVSIDKGLVFLISIRLVTCGQQLQCLV